MNIVVGKWAVFFGAFVLWSCSKPPVIEVGTCEFYFTVGTKKLSALTDVKRTIVQQKGVTTTEIQLIGPIVIVFFEDPNADYSGMFTVRRFGGVWETGFGNVEPGKIYFVERNKPPILIQGSLGSYQNLKTVVGNLSRSKGGAWSLSELIGSDGTNTAIRSSIEKIIDQPNEATNSR